MKRAFIVATNSDYTVLCCAENAAHAVRKAARYYKEEYDEERDDWTAYDLVKDYFDFDDDVMAIRAWVD